MAKKSSESSRPERLISVKSEDIKNRHWTEAERRVVREIALRQAAGVEEPGGPGDIPPLSDEQLAAMVRFRPRRLKVAVSVRLDAQVVEWLKSKGEGHLTRINDILTNLMEAEGGMRR